MFIFNSKAKAKVLAKYFYRFSLMGSSSSEMSCEKSLWIMHSSQEIVVGKFMLLNCLCYQQQKGKFYLPTVLWFGDKP